MRLRPLPLLAGLLMLTLGVGVVGTADRVTDQVVYGLTLVGCLVGAAANVIRHRRAGQAATWRHLANGAWLGGVLLPTSVALASGSLFAVAETGGGALGVGLLDGYDLGLTCLGVFGRAVREQTT